MLTHLYLQPHEKVASLGCGGGLWEVVASFDAQYVEFHLQDINQDLLNVSELQKTIQYFEKQFGRPTNCSFHITIGTPKVTNLPSNYFDKVLLINSFHEFDYQSDRLAECQRILKPNGHLIIEEQLAKYSGELHEGCGKRLFLEEELELLLITYNFEIKKTISGKNILLFNRQKHKTL